MTRVLRDESCTAQIASRIAETVRPGDLILLNGDLGAGKTTFVRHLASALGCPAAVSSPTFSLIQEATGGRVDICHADLYRLPDPADVSEIGMDHYLDGNWLVVVEWPQRVPDWSRYPRIWDLRFDLTSKGTRTLDCIPPDGEAW